MPDIQDEKASARRTVSDIYSDVGKSLFLRLPRESFSEPKHVHPGFFWGTVISWQHQGDIWYRWNNYIKTHNHPFLCLLAVVHGTTHRPRTTRGITCHAELQSSLLYLLIKIRFCYCGSINNHTNAHTVTFNNIHKRIKNIDNLKQFAELWMWHFPHYKNEDPEA